MTASCPLGRAEAGNQAAIGLIGSSVSLFLSRAADRLAFGAHKGWAVLGQPADGRATELGN